MRVDMEETYVMRRIWTAAAGAIMAVGLLATSAGAASAAPQPRPGHPKVYTTWPAAQRGAHFALLRPTDTVGLRRQPRILVAECPSVVRAGGWQHRRRPNHLVIAQYRAPRRHRAMISYTQTQRRRGGCALPVPARWVTIQQVKIDGHNATLTKYRVRVCISSGGVTRCRRTAIDDLTWVANRHRYDVTGTGVGARRVIRFARSLLPLNVIPIG
jgi:hypothetical protein